MKQQSTLLVGLTKVDQSIELDKNGSQSGSSTEGKAFGSLVGEKAVMKKRKAPEASREGDPETKNEIDETGKSI